ncbi:MAG: CpsD/CapB family tyrosine-protein kinase [Candidatus Omnitrophica bacterium]|nr:CpsD/CapB family tyrosine-protein kinase [Candidatus Omnitrophota bacterium]
MSLLCSPNEGGITSVLAEGLQLEKTIVHTGIKGLDLLPSGPVPPDPGRLVESQKIKDIINSLKEAYDIVIIDTPPAIAVNDAIILGAVADGVLCVIESQRTTFSMVEHVREVMVNAGINLIGVVLNKFKAHRTGYYHYYYNHYYKK